MRSIICRKRHNGWQKRSRLCPLCLRKTSDEDYEYISETLKRILNKESEIYSKALDEAMDVFVDVEMAIPKFPDRLNEEERRAQRATVQLNKDVWLLCAIE